MNLLEQALALQQAGQLADATILFNYVLAKDPDNPDLLRHLGALLLQQDKIAEGISHLQRAVQFQPLLAAGHCDLAVGFYYLQRYADALQCLDTALAIDAQYADAWLNRGMVMQKLGDCQQALVCYQQALACKPDYAVAYYNQGNTLLGAERFTEAVSSYQKACTLQADYYLAYNNLGSAFKNLADFTQAFACFDQAIAIKADFVDAVWNKAILKLLLGDYQEGWYLYHAGLSGEQRRIRDVDQKPLWLGEQSIAGQTLLIVAEQGLGDMLQFCRYVPWVQALGAKVILEVPASLQTLCATLAGDFELLVQNQPVTEFDYYCPLMSFPQIFKTTLETIPANVPYLYADKAKQEYWQQQLVGVGCLKVGIAWSGSSHHKNDRNRSMALQQLAVLFALPVDYYILQKDVRPADEALLMAYANLHDPRVALVDFSDTAALLSCMDLVISVDTSIAHLAGAMAKPVWVLLPYLPDFRWLLQRDDSPWYPTATLFRQDAKRQWSGVLEEVKKKLLDIVLSEPSTTVSEIEGE